MDPPSPFPPSLSPLLAPSPSAGYIPLRDLLALGPSLWDDEEEEEFKPLDEFDESGGGGAGHDSQPTASPREPNLEDRVKRRRRNAGGTAPDDAYEAGLEGNASPTAGGDAQDASAATNDKAFYQSFLRAFQSGEITLPDDDESDSYDFLDDLDLNAGAIQMDREDEWRLGEVDEEEIRFLNLDWMTNGEFLNSDRPFEAGEPAANNASALPGSSAAVDGDGFSASCDGEADDLLADERYAEAASSPAKRTRSHVASKRRYDVLGLQAPVSRYVLAPHELDATQSALFQKQLNAHLQLLAQGVEAALEAKQDDLVKLYGRMNDQIQHHFLEYYLENRTFHLDVLERAQTQRGQGVDAVVLAIGDLAQSEIVPPARIQKLTRGSKKTGEWMKTEQDKLLALAYERFSGQSQSKKALFELIQQNFFPLFTASFLENRWKSRIAREAGENVCKELHRRIKSRTPFNKAEIQELRAFCEPLPGVTPDWQEAQKGRRLHYRLPEQMERVWRRLCEAAVSRTALATDSGAALVPDDFDQDDIDSIADDDDDGDDVDAGGHDGGDASSGEGDIDDGGFEEADAQRALLLNRSMLVHHRPLRLRGETDGWTEQQDRALLLVLRDFLRPNAAAPDEQALMDVAIRVARNADQVSARFARWRRAYLNDDISIELPAWHQRRAGRR